MESIHGVSHPGVESPSASVELSTRRTGMAFQRTRLSADRTLMAVIRTSLALIGFGFTIYEFFRRLRSAEVLARGSEAPRQFGIVLVMLGIAMLLLGIWYQLSFMRALRRTRDEMVAAGLVHGQTPFPVSLTLIVAVLLLAVGLTAIIGMLFHVGSFG